MKVAEQIEILERIARDEQTNATAPALPRSGRCGRSSATARPTNWPTNSRA